jgi:hypothetical protein
VVKGKRREQRWEKRMDLDRNFWRRRHRGKGLNLDLRFRDFEARV